MAATPKINKTKNQRTRLEGTGDVDILWSRQRSGRDFHPLGEGRIAQTFSDFGQLGPVPHPDTAIGDLTVPIRRIEGPHHQQFPRSRLFRRRRGQGRCGRRPALVVAIAISFRRIQHGCGRRATSAGGRRGGGRRRGGMIGE